MMLDITPTDDLGIPLPIAPPEFLLPRNTPELADWHHHMHPQRDPRLNDVGGLALRNARLQLTDYDDHHREYHRKFSGPDIPKSDDQKFALTVLLVAGYIPGEVIDFSNRRARVREVRPHEKQRLWMNGELRMGSVTLIREFLTQYTLDQDLSHISEVTIDEFLNTSDKDRKRFLGHWLLAQALDRATEPISQTYRTAFKMERVKPGRPAKAASLVATQLGNVKRRDGLLPKLELRLTA